jgi:Rod binding domain-containing protein
MADFSTGLSAGASAAFEAMNSAGQPQPGSKVAGAAKDFEALLLTQILKSSHGEGGWLDTSDDDAGSAAVSFGEEQLAHTMASSGGLGLAKLIESGIDTATNQAANHATTAKLQASS